jgi:phosphate/sulfate permease
MTRVYQIVRVITLIALLVQNYKSCVARTKVQILTHFTTLGRVSSRAAVPWWILAYGAVALDIGLLTYGHHIMRALGNKIWYPLPTNNIYK